MTGLLPSILKCKVVWDILDSYQSWKQNHSASQDEGNPSLESLLFILVIEIDNSNMTPPLSPYQPALNISTSHFKLQTHT